jgi:ABC-type branched-subunit amino acid transport system ATPase component
MDLVQTVCRELAVLDFGRLIAHGPTADVLADPVVARAYLGTEELA